MTKILLIEDNEIDRFIVERQLALSGLNASMQSVISARSALELFTRQYADSGTLPDVILVDYFMPAMNGSQFLTALKNLDIAGKKNILIFVLTSLADARMHLDPALDSITGILEKPLTTAYLEHIVQLSEQHARLPKAV